MVSFKKDQSLGSFQSFPSYRSKGPAWAQRASPGHSGAGGPPAGCLPLHPALPGHPPPAAPGRGRPGAADAGRGVQEQPGQHQGVAGGLRNRRKEVSDWKVCPSRWLWVKSQIVLPSEHPNQWCTHPKMVPLLLTHGQVSEWNVCPPKKNAPWANLKITWTSFSRVASWRWSRTSFNLQEASSLSVPGTVPAESGPCEVRLWCRGRMAVK